MTFDPMKFYEDGKRRESRWGAVTPFILVGLLLLVMGVAGYFGYKGARPKHTLGSPAIIPYTKLAGVYCPEGVCPAIDTETDGNDYPVDAKDRLESHVPRKHKRRVDKFDFTPYPIVSVYEYLRFTNTVPAELTCTRKTRTSGLHCDSRPLTPAEIENYKPQPSDEGMKLEREKASAYDELVLDHDQVFYDDVFVPGGSCTDRERYRELQCVSESKCKLRNKEATWCLDASVDGDVPRTKIVPDCLYGGSVDGSIRPCTAHDNFTIHLNPSKPLDQKPYSQDTVWPTLTGTAQIQLTQKQKDAYASNAWMKPCGPDNHADSCFIPFKLSCVMPADIDVCPIQMLDKREATSGVQPVIANEEAGYSDAARASVFAAMLTCAVDPKASPEIILKAGPTIVPCATLKWATDAVDADKKKASHD